MCFFSTLPGHTQLRGHKRHGDTLRKNGERTTTGLAKYGRSVSRVTTLFFDLAAYPAGHDKFSL